MANGGGCGAVEIFQVDQAFEFCAPRFFDFTNEETEDDIQRAELWFGISLSYAPSPFMTRIREGRSVQIDSLCDFGKEDQDVKVQVANNVCPASVSKVLKTIRKCIQEVEIDVEVKVDQGLVLEDKKSSSEFISEDKPSLVGILQRKGTSDKTSSMTMDSNLSREEIQSFEYPVVPSNGAPVAVSAACTARPRNSLQKVVAPSTMKKHASVEICTPKSQRIPEKEERPRSIKNLTASKIANWILQPSMIKQKKKANPLPSSKNIKAKSTQCPGIIAAKNTIGTEIAQENQAVKRQKLDDGRSKQMYNVKNRVLPHKSRLGLTDDSSAKTCGEEKSVQKDNATSFIQRRPKLTLTRPKDPKLETAHRIRTVRIKSSAELEEEMLAKIPKFRARPLNMKILEAPTFSSLPKSVPKPPVFQEFHFKTMERANQHAETISVSSSVDGSVRNQIEVLKLTEPRPPRLETLLRAQPPKIKSSEELELQESEKVPKFRARPLNRKILESKGDIGLFCNPKPQPTVPQEFHFATNDRLGPPAAVVELFDKLSLSSESSNHAKEVSRITIPNPFHLHTDERGFQKEKQFAEQLLQKELEEEKARIPKATPYPYTTDYPVIPSKPEPRQCTKPETFQLESLARHEEDRQKKLEENARAEREEAQRRVFKAQPILKDDPLPLPERQRKALTEVQEFVLHVDHRSVQRTEFDNKIKEKELTYKRTREEQEYARMMEEEKALKQIRRTMVPQARPLPKFDNPFVPQKSKKEATKPKSPALRVNHRGGTRRQAVHMR